MDSKPVWIDWQMINVIVQHSCSVKMIFDNGHSDLYFIEALLLFYLLGNRSRLWYPWQQWHTIWSPWRWKSSVSDFMLAQTFI